MRTPLTVQRSFLTLLLLSAVSGCGILDSQDIFTSPLADFLAPWDTSYEVTLRGEPACAGRLITAVEFGVDEPGNEQAPISVSCNETDGEVRGSFDWYGEPSLVTVSLFGFNDEPIKVVRFGMNLSGNPDHLFDLQETGDPIDSQGLTFSEPEQGFLLVDIDFVPGGLGGGCNDATAVPAAGCDCVGQGCLCSPPSDNVASCVCTGPDCECSGTSGTCDCTQGGECT